MTEAPVYFPYCPKDMRADLELVEDTLARSVYRDLFDIALGAGGWLKGCKTALAGRCSVSVKRFNKALATLLKSGLISCQNGMLFVKRAARVAEQANQRLSRWRQRNGQTRPSDARAPSPICNQEATRESRVQDSDRIEGERRAPERAGPLFARPWNTRPAAPSAGEWIPPAENWERRLADWRKDGFWRPTFWGPEPGQRGCRVPRALLEGAGLAVA
jgi:hypothetical protein